MTPIPTTKPAVAKAPQHWPDFGPDLTYAQAIKSQTATLKGIKNHIPNATIYSNVMRLYNRVLVPIFAEFGPLPITSLYRSPALNKAIGGSATSAHLYGLAVDIDCDGLKHVTNKILLTWVPNYLQFDQAISEFDTATGPSWVHLGIKPQIADYRHQVLRAVKQKGKTVYLPA